MNLRVLPLVLALLAAGAQAQSLRPSAAIANIGLGAVAAGPRQADYITAVVNSEPITNNEVRARTVRLEQQLAQQGAALPPREELARQVLERLISDRAQLQIARDTGVRAEESVIDQAAANIAQQNGIEVTELRRRIEADGIGWQRFRDELRDQVLLQRLREREVDPRVKITEAEIDQFIREQQDSTDLANVEINLAHIVVAVPDGAGDVQVAALQARAQRALERARAGEDFGVLVREYSDAPDRGNGGQFGLRAADRYPPLFLEAVAGLRAGGLAGPVRSGAGFHVLKVVEKKQAGMPSVNVTQTHARHILLRTGPQLAESAARERLADFKKRVEAGQADFAALARENSQDASGRDGGDLGWTNPGVFVPEFEEVLNALAPGQVSAPFVSRFGVHIVQALGRRETTLSQREQREIVRNLLREKKTEEALVVWAQDVRGRAYVEYREAPQ